MGKRAERFCKDMIQSLASGMEGLNHFAARNDQNVDPNLKIMKVVDQETGMSKLVHQQIGTNFEA